MKLQIVQRTSCLLAVALLFAVQVRSFAQGRGQGIYGDWNITTQFGDRDFDSILAFSRNAEGERTASWITFFGMTELTDVSFENNQLKFTHTFRRPNNGDWTSKFEGTVEDGKLKGVLTSDRGESEVTGQRAPRMPRAVGSWAMTIKVGDREFTGTLNMKSDSSGNLTGEWVSRRGISKVKDISYNRGELAFTRMISSPNGEWESVFQGRIRGNSLSGISKSDRGEAETTGERVGAPAIGTWVLAIETDQGTRDQRLRINPDLSALYGSIPVDKVSFEDGVVSFNATAEFGDRTFDWKFQGQIEDDSLTGKVTSSRGTREVTGKKIVRNFRRGR